MSSGSPSPVVRLFVPCSAVRCDTTVLPNRYTLEDPFSALRPPAGRSYPFRAAELWLFCQLTDATGVHLVEVDLLPDLGAPARTLHSFRVDMGADRLAVRNYAVRLRQVPFQGPGLYEVHLRVGSSVLAQAVVRLEV